MTTGKGCASTRRYEVRCHDAFPRYAGWHSISKRVINGAAPHRNAQLSIILQKRKVQTFQCVQHKSKLREVLMARSQTKSIQSCGRNVISSAYCSAYQVTLTF
jgi:hypothetical protein